MAVGATRHDIVRLVLQDGSRLVLCGLAWGLLVTLMCSRFVGSFLFGVSARDPLILAGVAPILGCVALIACIIPAGRAARADPLVALRCE